MPTFHEGHLSAEVHSQNNNYPSTAYTLLRNNFKLFQGGKSLIAKTAFSI